MFKSNATKSAVFLLLSAWVITCSFCSSAEAHHGLGDEQSPAASVEVDCQITALPSTVLAVPIIAAQNKTSNHSDPFLHLYSSLNLGWGSSIPITGEDGPEACPFSTLKRYQLFCTYRL